MATPPPTTPTATATGMPETAPHLGLTPRGARQLPSCPGAPGPKPRVPMSAAQRGDDGDDAVAKRRLFATLDFFDE
tara:strand:+ start:187 stop:414 length:228 start_codon:yes stop_codon:yes gene_type:complete